MVHLSHSREGGFPTPARNPRVNVVLEKPVYDIVGRIAREEGTSLSTVVRDLVKEAVELREDVGLTRLATDRERTLPRRGALSHKEVWG